MPITNHPIQDDVWLIVLAAGQATRMGRPKMLLPIHGEELLRGVVKKALTAMKNVVVVLRREGAGEEDVISDLPVRILYPDQRLPLMSDSLKTAIHFCQEEGASAVIIVLGDQPGIDPNVIRQIREAYQTSQSLIIQANYWDGPSHPILFDRHFFGELLQVDGDQGAREIVKRYRSKRRFVSCYQNQPKDLDTLDDYETYLRQEINKG
ncbi:MAG TPA: nucleotidyltransferase family protein [Sporolactobacillaceae bacterium]|nr:nucleotidyltransferase family protein [Sporolactobacillaceae bacterium]